MSELTEPIQRFIAENIASVAQLEVLLLLKEHPDHSWTAAEVARSLYTGEPLIAVQLADWASRGLLASPDDRPELYRYAPSSQELAETVDGLADAYRARRVSVITAIYSQPMDKVRTFADAFRLRKGDQK